MRQKANLFILFLILFIGQVSYVKADTTIASGFFTNQLKWELSKSVTGTGRNQVTHYNLEIIGGGVLNLANTLNVPWANLNGTDYRTKITSITIGKKPTSSADINKIHIGDYAFEGYTALNSVTLYNQGTIGNGAFRSCTNLSSVSIGPGEKEFTYASSVSAAPFYGCSKLSKINTPSSIAALASFLSFGNLQYLTDGQYGTASEKIYLHGGRNVSSFSIPEGVTSIPNCALRYFTNLEHITIPSTVTDIPDYNFANHTYLKEVTLNNTGSIGIGAFKYCTALTRVNVGAGVKELRCSTSIMYPDMPFEFCHNLSIVNITNLDSYNRIANLDYLTDPMYGTSSGKTLMINGVEHDPNSELVIPEGWTEVQYNAFRHFKNVTKVKIPSSMKTISHSISKYITEITLPSTVTSVEDYAFSGCSALATVTLNNRGTIGVNAFYGCESLSRINIGASVTGFGVSTKSSAYGYKYGSETFYGCSSLSTVNVSSLASFLRIEHLEYLTNSSYGTAKEKTLMVNGVIHSSSSELVIPEGITSIPNYAFRDFKNVTKIKLPSTMTDIPDYNFANHTYLKEVTLNNTGSIGNGVFMNCTALTKVSIGEGVTEFKTTSSSTHNPFYGCPNLSEVNVANVASFVKIVNLHYLTNSSYGTAEEKTLMVNGNTHSSSSELVVPEGVTEIPNVAFRYFENVTKIKLPSTMTKIADRSFENHTYLTKINLPSTVTSVGSSAFRGCTNLKRIICQATTPPSAYYSIASNPSEIAVKVPTGKTATYKATSIWNEFSIDEGRTLSYDVTMLPNESKQFTSDLLDYLNVKSRTTTNSSIASPTVSSNILTIKAGNNPTYDGSTTLPYKSAVISLKLEDDDQLVYNVEVYPREAELTDGNAYKNTKEFEVDKISYTRSFSQAGKWQAIYLPFAFDVEKYRNDFDIAEIFTICPTSDTNGDGQLDANDDKKLIISVLKSGETQPNAPYMIRPKAATTYTIVSENTTLASAEINEVEFGTSRTQYSVKGIYDADFYAVPGDNNIYITASGGFGVAKNKNVNVKPNRWILHEEAKNYVGSSTSSSNVKAADITIEVLGEDIDETTAIRLINGETISAEGKSNTMYNLNGMKVDSSKSLPSGIYIINGKKVFKK